MKKALIIVVSMLVFMLLWCYIGSALFPYLGWLTGWRVDVLPRVFAILLGLCFVVCESHALYQLYGRHRGRYFLTVVLPWLIVIAVCVPDPWMFHHLELLVAVIVLVASVFIFRGIFMLIGRKCYHPFLLLPLFLTNSILAVYFVDRYYKDESHMHIFEGLVDIKGNYLGDYIIPMENRHRNYYGGISSSEGIWYDKFGNVVFGEGCIINFINNDNVMVSYNDVTKDETIRGLFSLSKRRYIIPMGESIRSCCSIKEYDGRKGIVSDNGDVVVPYRYSTIDYMSSMAIGKDADGAFVVMDELGMLQNNTECYSVDDKYVITQGGRIKVYSDSLSTPIADFDASDFGHINRIFNFDDKYYFKVKYQSGRHAIVGEDSVMVYGYDDVVCYNCAGYHVLAGNKTKVYSSNMSVRIADLNLSYLHHIVNVYILGGRYFLKVKYLSGEYAIVDSDGYEMVKGDANSICYSCESFPYENPYYIFAGNSINVYTRTFSKCSALANYSSGSRLCSVYDNISPLFYRIKLQSGSYDIVSEYGKTVLMRCYAIEASYYYAGQPYDNFIKVKYSYSSDWVNYTYRRLRDM